MEIIALLIGFIGLLVYLFIHERDQRNYIKKIQTDLSNMPVELQKYYTELSKKDNDRNQKLIGDSFDKFLKHIEKLERMTLPKPVTTKDVQDVLNRTGEISEIGKFENDIEKETDKGVQLPQDQWTGFINGDTKVAFEDEELPTVVENTPAVVK